jgi:hypothetical protein
LFESQFHLQSETDKSSLQKIYRWQNGAWTLGDYRTFPTCATRERRQRPAPLAGSSAITAQLVAAAEMN